MPSIKFYIRNPLDEHRKLRNKELSIYAVFTRNREERFLITIDEKIFPKHWDFKNQQVKGTYRGHVEVNSYLADLKANLLKLHRDNREMPFEKFKILATQKPTQEKKTLFVALDQFLSQYQAEKDSKTLGKYHALKAQLIAFDQSHNIDLKDLNARFYDSFKTHLYAIPNPNYRKFHLAFDSDTDSYGLVPGTDGPNVGLFDDTVYKYIINLKTFLKWAEKRDYLVNPSYKSWEIVRRKHEPISLTKDELSKLQSYTFESKSQDIARDYVVLMCLTGQRISDIKRFNVKDVSGNEWTFVQKKGQRLVNSKVTVPFEGFIAPALDILLKYNWKLPEISEQKINKHIKTACKMAGIDAPVEYIRWAQNKKIRMVAPKYEFVSNHTGRKTFITLALQEGLSIEHVMSITGISEYDTIKHYRARFETAAIKEALGKIVMRKAL